MLDNEQICYSQSYISKAFKKKYGIDVSQYVNQVRIARAKKLIRDGSRNIKEIALQVGYSSDAQFIRVFQKFEAATPGVFRTENEQSERGSGQCAFSAAAAREFVENAGKMSQHLCRKTMQFLSKKWRIHNLHKKSL